MKIFGATGASVKSGDISFKTTGTYPGYVECNGGIVARSVNPSLYGTVLAPASPTVVATKTVAPSQLNRPIASNTDGSKIVMVGWSNHVSYASIDGGVSWTSGALPNYGTGWRYVGFDTATGAFVAFSSLATFAAWSYDGVSWTPFNVPNMTVLAGTYDGSKFVLVGNASYFSGNLQSGFSAVSLLSEPATNPVIHSDGVSGQSWLLLSAGGAKTQNVLGFINGVQSFSVNFSGLISAPKTIVGGLGEFQIYMDNGNAVSCTDGFTIEPFTIPGFTGTVFGAVKGTDSTKPTFVFSTLGHSAIIRGIEANVVFSAPASTGYQYGAVMVGDKIVVATSTGANTYDRTRRMTLPNEAPYSTSSRFYLKT